MIQGLFRSQQPARLSSAFRLVSRRIISSHLSSPPFKNSFHYQSGTRNDSGRAAVDPSFAGEKFNSAVLAFFREYRIGLPKELKILKGQINSKNGLSVYMAKRHVIYHGHVDIYNVWGHPLVTMSMSKYAAKDAAESLWVYTDGTEGKAVVRRTCMKRAKKAFWAAMRANGYDKFGRRLEPESQEEDANDMERPGVRVEKQALLSELRCTIGLRVVDPKLMLKLSYGELVKSLTELIRKQVEPALTGTKQNREWKPSSFKGPRKDNRY